MTPSLVPALHRAVHAIALSLDRTLGDLTQAEAHVLAHLAESGPSTVGQLHRAFGHRRSTLTSVLDRLEGRGHVRRELNPADRRTFTIVPTAGGKKAGRRARAALEQIESSVLVETSDAELAAFRRVLERIEAAARG
jgi:DNA-binding MarR family transcriptional regulator